MTSLHCPAGGLICRICGLHRQLRFQYSSQIAPCKNSWKSLLYLKYPDYLTIKYRLSCNHLHTG